MEHEPIGYSLKVAGEIAGNISRATIYRLVRHGKLELVKIGGRSIITRRSIERLLPEITTRTPTAPAPKGKRV